MSMEGDRLDTILMVHHRSPQRDRLEMLIQQVTDEEIEDAVQLLEWFTDPERRYLVEQIIRLSEQASRG